MSYWLTPIDVSERLGIDLRRVLDLIDAGNLQAERVGRTTMVRPSEVERYVRTAEPA